MSAVLQLFTQASKLVSLFPEVRKEKCFEGLVVIGSALCNYNSISQTRAYTNSISMVFSKQNFFE